MGPSIANHYVTRIREAELSSESWSWPRELCPKDSEPDTRLLSANISGFSAKIEQGDGRSVDAAVRSITSNDLVLDISNPTQIAVRGQVVRVTLCFAGDIVFRQIPCVLHWNGQIDGRLIVGLFAIQKLVNANRWQQHEARQAIRYPVNLDAVVEVSSNEFVAGTIVDYGLNGCRFVAEKDIPLDGCYRTRVLLRSSTVDVHLRPRWIHRTASGQHLGCAMNPEEGVLLACRHHVQPIGLTLALKPATSDWNPDQTT